jgi:hypothetical protein
MFRFTPVAVAAVPTPLETGIRPMPSSNRTSESLANEWTGRSARSGSASSKTFLMATCHCSGAGGRAVRLVNAADGGEVRTLDPKERGRRHMRQLLRVLEIMLGRCQTSRARLLREARDREVRELLVWLRGQLDELYGR